MLSQSAGITLVNRPISKRCLPQNPLWDSFNFSCCWHLWNYETFIFNPFVNVTYVCHVLCALLMTHWLIEEHLKSFVTWIISNVFIMSKINKKVKCKGLDMPLFVRYIYFEQWWVSKNNDMVTFVSSFCSCEYKNIQSLTNLVYSCNKRLFVKHQQPKLPRIKNHNLCCNERKLKMNTVFHYPITCSLPHNLWHQVWLNSGTLL